MFVMGNNAPFDGPRPRGDHHILDVMRREKIRLRRHVLPRLACHRADLHVHGRLHRVRLGRVVDTLLHEMRT
jgi:hypothetical protein